MLKQSQQLSRIRVAENPAVIQSPGLAHQQWEWMSHTRSLQQSSVPESQPGAANLKGSWRAAGPWSVMKSENSAYETQAISGSGNESQQLGGIRYRQRGTLLPGSGPLFIWAFVKGHRPHLGRSFLIHWVHQGSSSGEVPNSCDSNFWQNDVKTNHHRVHRDESGFFF